MWRQDLIFIRFNAYSVNKNTLLIKNHVLVEHFDQDFTVLQESWHVNTVLEIVN